MAFAWGNGWPAAAISAHTNSRQWGTAGGRTIAMQAGATSTRLPAPRQDLMTTAALAAALEHFGIHMHRPDYVALASNRELLNHTQHIL